MLAFILPSVTLLTVSLQSEPLGNRSVLSGLLGELLLDSESLLGRLGLVCVGGCRVL